MAVLEFGLHGIVDIIGCCVEVKRYEAEGEKAESCHFIVPEDR